MAMKKFFVCASEHRLLPSMKATMQHQKVHCPEWLYGSFILNILDKIQLLLPREPLLDRLST